LSANEELQLVELIGLVKGTLLMGYLGISLKIGNFKSAECDLLMNKITKRSEVGGPRH